MLATFSCKVSSYVLLFLPVVLLQNWVLPSKIRYFLKIGLCPTCSNTTTLSFDDVVSSLLLEDMRWKNMEGQSTDALFVRGQSHERDRFKSLNGRSKYKGRSKSIGNFVKVCWICGKQGHFKKKCRSKSVERVKGCAGAPSTEENTSKEEGGDM
jgi:hypothetical protein